MKYKIILKVLIIFAIIVTTGCNDENEKPQCEGGVLVNVDGEYRCMPSADYIETLSKEAPKEQIYYPDDVPTNQ